MFVSCCWQLAISVLLLAAPGSTGISDAVQVDRDGSPDDPGLARYVSRPDLRAPKWDLKVHHPELNSPGSWFVAPYRGLNGEQSDKSWVGPFIYDNAGELVWSGGLMFDSNVEDFTLSDVNGETLLTLMAHSKAYLLNDDYTIRKAIGLETEGVMNTHELNFVDGGRRAIFLKNGQQKASREQSKAVAFDGECDAKFDGFSELDLTTDDWPHVFDWHSYGRIGMEESTYLYGTPEDRCTAYWGWDFVHANSVDKTPQGDYLFSARHTDTIYKISGTNGSIIWRLGGKQSDFEMHDAVFSRQHNVRYRGQNQTHFWISILDNAKGQDPQPATHDFSRGLLIAVNEDTMEASLEQHFNHPYGGKGEALAPRRGNYQLLPNGNVFLGWSERAMQSEHTPQGKLIWEAILQVDWMGSYRNYKFDGFVGRPKEPPTAVALARTDGQKQETTTTVFVSWNGATEVAAWKMYRTTPDGKATRLLVAAADKTGFETSLSYSGYAKYVVVDALDKRGRRIGSTPSLATMVAANVSAEAVADEEAWLEALQIAKDRPAEVPAQNGLTLWYMALFIGGAACGVTVVLVFWHARQFGLAPMLRQVVRRGQRYTPVSQWRGEDEDGLPLRKFSIGGDEFDD